MKKEYIILALIIGALSTYLFFHQTDSTHYSLPVLDTLADQDITRLDISQGETGFILEKNDDRWVVGDEKLPARATPVSAMVKAVKEFKLTALVSESKSYSRYELDDSSRIRVEAFNNDKRLRTFDVGKTAASYNHTFVRLDGDHRVYHAEDNIKTIFDTTEDKLIDKQVMAFESTMVHGFTVKDQETALALERKQKPLDLDVTGDKTPGENEGEGQKEDIWVDASGSEKDMTKINAFVVLFSNLTCEAYIKGKTKEDWSDPMITVTITADKPYTLSIFPKKEDDTAYPAISSESTFPFLLPEAKIEDIRKKLSEI